MVDVIRLSQIPLAIFVNKKDLESRGIYVGAISLTRWITDLDVKIYETTNTDLETFMIPIRLFLNELEGFPIDASQIVFNNIHEVY